MLRLSMTMFSVICLITGCQTPVDTVVNRKTNAKQTSVKENDDSLLIKAAEHGDTTTVLSLLQNGADVNLQDDIHDNPFLYAGAEGMLEIVKLTIDAGADTKLTNRYGGTALIPASEHGHVEVVKELLERTDVDVNHINRSGWTALLEAIVLGNGGLDHQKVVQLLVDHEADVQIPDKAGVTPHCSMRKEAGIRKSSKSC